MARPPARSTVTAMTTIDRPRPAEDVILRDGSTLRLRPPTESDAQAVVDFFAALSPESRYLRFHGTTDVDARAAESFLHTDWDERGSLLGELAGEGVVALATFVRLRDPHRAEVAFAVADRLQGRGIGTRLLERLAAHAARAGIEEFVAQVLPQNRAMQGVFADAGFAVRRKREDGVLEYRLEITPTQEYRARIDERDHVAVCVPAAAVLDAAESALQRGVKALCVISAGFAEVGREGLERQERLLALVRAHGARLIGPNCLGIAAAGPRLNATFAGRQFPPGRAAFSSQSGALGIALLEQAEARGLGLSSFVSIGNKADVSSNDLLEYWEDDDATDLILLYLESFGNPRKFARIASRVARSKPILAMRSGVSRVGARAASSHTAALAGSDAAVEALFRQAGVLRARTLEELID